MERCTRNLDAFKQVNNSCTCDFGLFANVGVFREPVVYEPLICEFEDNSVAGCETPIYRHRSDVYLLFNQKRLDKISLQAFVENLNALPQTDGLKTLRSKMTDEQLHSFVKSRYIQTPSEMLSWSSYLMAKADELKVELSAAQVSSEQTVSQVSSEQAAE